jgi:hypothetical protein
VATGCLVLAVAAGWSDVLFVVLGHVFPGWAVGAVLLLPWPVLVRVGAARRRSDNGRMAAGRRVIPWRVVRGLLAAAAGAGSVVGWLSDMGADYHVLRPEGPGGCTAVVREESFLGGRGEVYVSGPIGIVRRPAGSWWTDDGYRPIAEGTYELRWSRNGGTLTVRGDEVDPVMNGEHRIDCD